MQRSIIWIAFFLVSVFFSTLNASAQSGKLPGLKGTVSYLEKQLKALPCKTDVYYSSKNGGSKDDQHRLWSTGVMSFKLIPDQKIKLLKKESIKHQDMGGPNDDFESWVSVSIFPQMEKLSYKLVTRPGRNGGCFGWIFYCEENDKCVENSVIKKQSDKNGPTDNEGPFLDPDFGFFLSGNEADQERIKRAFNHLFSLMEKKEKQQEAADPFAAPTSGKEPNSPTIIDEPTSSNVIILD
jgi:hypothetical protein